MTVRGRPRGFDRNGALQQAMVVFWRKGFAAASMNDLCDAMGIGSPSLYAAFGSKEELYLEAIEHNVQTVGMPAVWKHLNGEASARAGVEAVLLAAAARLPGDAFTPSGCLLTLASMGEACPGKIPETLRSLREQLFNMLRSKLKAAKAAGEISPSANVDRLARFYLGVYQGISTQARDGATRQQLVGIAEIAMDAWPPTAS